MPRRAREKSENGIYHIILRGINKQMIFEDEEDSIKFLQVLEKNKDRSCYKIYAYCLMGNHIHLLLHEGKEEIGLVMKRIGASYVYWYNWKYERCGHLFQDRYKSEAVENESYFITVLRYIHQNPVKAGIVNDISSYRWSSYNEYIWKNKITQITDVDKALDMINQDREKAQKCFEAFHKEINMDGCLEIEENRKLRDDEAIEVIKQVCKISSCLEIQNCYQEQRDSYLKELKKVKLSTRQISRLTGISRQIVLKA